MNIIKRKKVFVGLSGGVDSSVSAALLKEQGYDVTGVFIKVWYPPFLKCNWREDRFDAMRVCAHLDIPFLTIDLEKEYKKEVVDYMVEGYKNGITPNPDVMCNKNIKFGGFLEKALSMGADYIATGHYAINRYDKEDCIYRLYAGVDKDKDQTYFLWTLVQKQLKHSLFPVGEYTKSEVRKLAERFGLVTAEKKESQGLCFLGKVDLEEFLQHYIPSEKGDVLNEKGDVIGWHNGSYYYTLGQRHGFIITKKSPDDTPYYIVSKDVSSNKIIVSQREDGTVLSSNKREIRTGKINWSSGREPDLDKKYKARIRYRQSLQDCKIRKNEDTIEVVFDKDQESISSGQSIVFYNGEECIGGAIIE